MPPRGTPDNLPAGRESFGRASASRCEINGISKIGKIGKIKGEG